MLKLYINGSLCDLKGEEDISIDYEMMSIDDISKRKGSRSFTFEIPRTANNTRILETSEQVTNLTTIPYTKLDARLLSDGIDLGIRFAELVSTKKNYSINLYGDNASFFEIIKNRNLTDLDLTEFNHTFDFTTIVASRNNDVGDGYIYPIINYGKDETIMGNVERICQAGALLPALYVDDVLPKIVSEAGYTLDNKMLDDTDYTDNPIIIPSSSVVFGNRYNAIFGIGTDTVCNEDLSVGIIDIIDIDSITSYTGNYWSLPYNTIFKNGGTVSFGKGLRKDFPFECKVRFTFIIENTTPFSAGVAIELSGNEVNPNTEIVATVHVNPGTATYTFEGDLDDSLNQWVDSSIKKFIPRGNSNITIKAGSTIEIYDADEQSIIYDGGEVNVSSLLPNIKQSDFIRNYCQMFCLLPIVDEDNKTVTLINFNQVEKNINEGLDWSNKIDLTDEPEIKYLVDEYAQRNAFKWMIDDGEQQPTGTNWELNINNENLEQDKDIVELLFASTFTDNMLLNMPIPRIGIWEQFNQYVSDKKPRLLILYRLSPNDFADTSDFIYKQAFNETTLTGSDLIPLARFIDTDYDYNLGFGRSLFTYYEAIRGIVENYKMVTCQLRLNASDINQLDFLKPVYINYFNAYFYVSKIKGYKAGSSESTECELVKLF